MDMTSVFEQYNGIYQTLLSYVDSFDAANTALKRTELFFKEQCISVETKFRMALSENEKVEKQIRAYINIAQAHTSLPNESFAPLSLDSGKLAQLSVQINNSSANDSYASQLFTEATGQLISIHQAVTQLEREYADEIKVLSTRYATDESEIKRNVDKIIDDATELLYSPRFVSFIAALKENKTRFISSANQSTDYVVSNTLSVGTVQCSLPLPSSLKAKMIESASGLYNSITETIGIPVNIDLSDGAVIIVQYSNNNEHIMLSGLQNVLLNVIRFMNSEYSQIAFFDPIRFNASSLGCLAPLSSGKNSFIDAVPVSMDDVRNKIKRIIASINEDERRRMETMYKPLKRLYVFHNFPHAYDSSLVIQIQQLCVNAAHYGITVILTNTISSNSTVSADVLEFLKTKSINIFSDEHDFNMRTESNDLQSKFEWYLAPQVLPQDVVQRFISAKPVLNMSNVYEDRVDIINVPNYKKGIRQLTGIPFGIDSNGTLLTLDFENSNFATFICGAARSGKSTLLHTIITGIIKNNHPDDVEIWLIDFKMTEFSRYIDHMPPHVRYIILDESPELVYDIIDRLSEILMKRQNLFKGKWTKLSEVPHEKYMPTIFVVIDEFSVMSQIIADSLAAGKDNYSLKLQTLLAKGAALGLRFIFASQGFTSGTRGLNDFSKKQVQQRIAMKTEYAEIKATLDLMSASDDDKAMMEQLPVHHALLRIPMDERGNHLLYTQVLHISDYAMQEKYINAIRNVIVAAPRYDVTSLSTYINKRPMIIDGNNYFPFSAKKEEIAKYLSERNLTFESRDEYALFIGEPRRMLSLFPVEVSNSFCENIILVASSKEKMPASSVVMSILESLKLQNSTVEFWSPRKHPIYRQTIIESSSTVATANELGDICNRIRKIKGAIQQKSGGNRFFVLLGFESFIIDMSFQKTNSDVTTVFKSPLAGKAVEAQYEKRKENEPDLMSLLSEIEPGSKAAFSASTISTEADSHTPSDGERTAIYDAREDLKFILTHGPKLGYHFLMFFNTAGEITQSKIDMSLFRHRILFRIPKIDAMTLIGAAGAGVIAELEDRSFRYTNGLDGISFRPYLHPGLSWDGWQMNGDSTVNIVDEEEEYLL